MCIHGFHGSCKWWTVNSRSHLIHENFEHSPSLLFIVKKMLHHCYLLCLITNEVISFLPTKLISPLISKNHCHSVSTERQNLRKKLIFQNCQCHCWTVSVSCRFFVFHLSINSFRHCQQKGRHSFFSKTKKMKSYNFFLLVFVFFLGIISQSEASHRSRHEKAENQQETKSRDGKCKLISKDCQYPNSKKLENWNSIKL